MGLLVVLVGLGLLVVLVGLGLLVVLVGLGLLCSGSWASSRSCNWDSGLLVIANPEPFPGFFVNVTRRLCSFSSLLSSSLQVGLWPARDC